MVTASRFVLRNPPRNPFFIPIDGFGPGSTIIRTFDVEATDESEVRRLWDQAQKDGFENLRGFTIDKIEAA